MQQLSKRIRSITTLILCVLTLATTSSAAGELLSEAEIFIEINDTDGDAGIQLFLDGEGWDFMELTSPNDDTLLEITGTGSIGMQGITELFFESAEPSFDVQTLEELLALFPEGDYEFEGTTTEGVPLVGDATLTHALPAAPVLVLPVEDADDVDPANAVIVWMPVADPPGSEIISYEVIVEKDEGALRVFKADMGPGATTVTVPPEFLEPGTAYKFEVLAKEASGNQTISEREFETAD